MNVHETIIKSQMMGEAGRIWTLRTQVIRNEWLETDYRNRVAQALNECYDLLTRTA